MKKIAFAFLLALAACSSTPSQQTTSVPTNDPYLWLEDVESPKALEWVQQQNQKSLAELESDPRFKTFEGQIKTILTAKDRIPYVSVLNGQLVNFWQDEKNVRGLWRRTTIAEYKKKEPLWETLLDLDELAKAEGENWVFKGSSCLVPEAKRCLLRLSRGGKDASVIREFDMIKKEFVKDGFALPEAKSNYEWIDENTLMIGTDFGAGSMTDSGYANEVRIWKRGTPYKEAKLIFKGDLKDVATSGFVTHWRTQKDRWISRGKTFYTSLLYHLDESDKATLIPVPEDIEFNGLFDDRLIFILRTDWKEWKAGDAISIGKAAALRGQPDKDVQLILRPSSRAAIRFVAANHDTVFISVIENVTTQVQRADWKGQQWKISQVKLPKMGAAGIQAVSPFESIIIFSYEDYLTPPSVYLSMKATEVPQKIKSLPTKFKSQNLVVEQFEATSKDGTKIPYFLIRTRGKKVAKPTVLYGYGGFESSQTPYYTSVTGKVWLEQGNSYVVANIRGGGEFGPKWHQAALKEKRQNAFDDFAAVGEDLIKRGYTTSKLLGIRGGSNGGLLTGASFTQRPDLFGAVLCQVPLLDMLRYHKLLAGASWMGEYGNPDQAAEAEFIKKYSPYQNVKADAKYPRVFFMTSTKDDRVHPGHARKMVARMNEQGHPLLYFENTEGGHSAAANLNQRARMESLAYVYFFRQLKNP